MISDRLSVEGLALSFYMLPCTPLHDFVNIFFFYVNSLQSLYSKTATLFIFDIIMQNRLTQIFTTKLILLKMFCTSYERRSWSGQGSFYDAGSPSHPHLLATLQSAAELNRRGTVGVGWGPGWRSSVKCDLY